MRKAQTIAGLSSALVLATSLLNLIAKERMYPNATNSELFFANDIVNMIVPLAFIALILLTRPKPGLYIGIDSANIYIAVPLILIYGLKPQALIPAAAIAIAAYGIIDQLKIEEVLVTEKGPIKKEHISYIAISALFCALFIARASGILTKQDVLAQDRITSIADLALVAIWLVLMIISIVNVDKRVPSLTGIMTSGTALNLSLILYVIIDSLAGKESLRIADLVVIAAMSLVFFVPSYRLLRKKPS